MAGIDTYDVTHAVSGRQKRSKQVDTKSQGVYPSMLASKISIRDLLEVVKSTHRRVLSEDVLMRLGELKSEDGYYSGRVRFSVGDTGIEEAEEQKPRKNKVASKPPAESLPLIAKKDLRGTVMSLFSIPDGQRAELGAVVDGYADRLIKNGTLTEEDRQAFFDRMYEAGVMTVPADEYYAEARSYLKGSKIYVSDMITVCHRIAM